MNIFEHFYSFSNYSFQFYRKLCQAGGDISGLFKADFLEV